MSEHNVIPTLSQDTFDLILNRLIDDQKFREIFFRDPQDAVQQLGIHLTSEELAALRDFDWTKTCKSMVTFNEKLVLCSSSGY